MEDIKDDIEDDDINEIEDEHLNLEENTGTCFPSKSFMT